jgi:CRISPR-associated protein Csb1
MDNNTFTQAPRLLLEADLKPIQGDRLQPTGFADLGAAVYERPDSTRMLLVESAQSVANRLEQTCLLPGRARLDPDLAGLPYVLVKLEKKATVSAETSSLFEAHRINSPFIIANHTFEQKFREATGYSKGQPLSWPSIAKGIFKLDPNSLLHGVFMANFEDGRIKMPRILTGFIEAENVREAHSGGVKNNPIDPSGTLRVEGYDKDVYGNVPYHRKEFVAARITAYFNLDLALLRSYDLGQPAVDLLANLAIYKIRRFLNQGLRLRTACDLKVTGEPRVTAPAGFSLPTEEDAKNALKAAIKQCASKKMFADPAVTELKTPVIVKVKDSKADSEEGAE